MTEQTQTLARPANPSAELSERHGETDWLRRRRAEAWELYKSLPMPRLDEEDWRRTDVSKLRLEDFETLATADSAATWDHLPPGLRSASAQGDYSAFSIQVDSTSALRHLPAALAEQGIVFTDLQRPHMSTLTCLRSTSWHPMACSPMPTALWPCTPRSSPAATSSTCRPASSSRKPSNAPTGSRIPRPPAFPIPSLFLNPKHGSHSSMSTSRATMPSSSPPP